MSKQKKCRQCHKQFRLITLELEFYQKQGYPEPDKCPSCRENRRMTLRNPHQFFKRPCDRCKKTIITTHNPSKGRIVYCEVCYASYYDRVDPLEKDRAPSKEGKIVKE